MTKDVKILGYQTSNAGLSGDIETAWQIINSGTTGNYVACTNPHSLVVARNDVFFSEALKKADILLPDGIGIVLAAKILGLNLEERVAGYEFFTGLSQKANESNKKVKIFFLGSTEAVLDKIKDKLSRDYPNLVIVGSISPPFKPEFSDQDNESMISEINKVKPDVLWVGMTAPKQEKWIYQNKDKLNVPLMGAIGAVFDFYAGTKKRSSSWVCKLGIEWLPRLLREPRRLFKRNFISSPLFLIMVFKEKLGIKRS